MDYKTKNPLNGRASVRLTSKKSYDVGTLFVADITHMVTTLLPIRLRTGADG